MAFTFQELKEQFDIYFKEHIPFPHHPAQLYEPCHYILDNSGKRVRPMLCLIAAQLFSERISEDVFKAAMAIELFHNFTLIHDDIMDHAPLRRGRPTIHERYGITAGILSGDVMNIYSYKCLSSISPQYLSPTLDLFNQTAIEVCEGQQLDMDYEQREELSEEEYLEMIRLKTSVLIGCGLKAGAILSDASAAQAENLYHIGINLGMAFQLQDDYLDTFGDSQLTGKQVGGDIMANKNTYLLIKAKELATDAQNELLATLVNSKNQNKVDQTIQLFKELGIKDIAKEKIKIYFDQAIAGIALLPQNDATKTLNQLVTQLIQRDY